MVSILFDEVDALAGDRAAPNDVGEIRRVLNSFLQFLEEDMSESLIVAALPTIHLLDNVVPAVRHSHGLRAPGR